MDNINNSIRSVTSLDRFIKIAKYSPCQILRCYNCYGWKCNDEIDRPSMNSVCNQFDCNHTLYDHVSHLLHASEEMLNALTRLISDFENLRDEIEKLPPCDQRNYLLKESKDFVFHINIYQNEITNYTSPNSLVSIEDSIEVPPFESPTMVEILMNFCLYTYSTDIHSIKLAFKITSIILKKFDSWNWISPEKHPYFKRLKHNNNYEFYYQRYQEYSIALKSNTSKIKPMCSNSQMFGQDILKYTLKLFKPYFTDWCLNESKQSTFRKKCLFTKLMPKYLNLLEKEVYDIDDSPIWNPNFMNMLHPRTSLDSLNSKLNELKQNQSGEHKIHLKTAGTINKNSLNKFISKIPDEKYKQTFKNYSSMDKIIEKLEFIDMHTNTSLKNFMANWHKPQIQANFKPVGIETIVFDYSSNFTKCVLCRNELRNMYQTRMPRLSDAYITRLETDEKLNIAAMLEDGVPVGGIYFCPFNSQGFSEIVLCIFKVDLLENGYESRLMNYLKDYHIKLSIWNLLVYTDKNTFAYFKNNNFSSEVNVLKTKYDKYIIHYEDSKLMHCNLNKSIK